jgi:hypothetical protein
VEVVARFLAVVFRVVAHPIVPAAVVVSPGVLRQFIRGDLDAFSVHENLVRVPVDWARFCLAGPLRAQLIIPRYEAAPDGADTLLGWGPIDFPAADILFFEKVTCKQPLMRGFVLSVVEGCPTEYVFEWEVVVGPYLSVLTTYIQSVTVEPVRNYKENSQFIGTYAPRFRTWW